MRTTLSIDDDVSSAIERFQTQRGLKFREAINLLLRSGLANVVKRSTSKPYSGPVFESDLVPGMDPNRMNQLADELESEDFSA
ncbi:antitoxin [bacterium]|jgi:hypothetical protein|nr:antitoxin [bacterium]